MAEKSAKRFEVIYKQGMGSYKIFVDKLTGVQYLMATEGYGGGLTPLLDREGKPIISPVGGNPEL